MVEGGKEMPARITVERHVAIMCCRKCDRIMEEEPGSPKPRGYFLFKCKTCSNLVGVVVLALAAQQE